MVVICSPTSWTLSYTFLLVVIIWFSVHNVLIEAKLFLILYSLAESIHILIESIIGYSLLWNWKLYGKVGILIIISTGAIVVFWSSWNRKWWQQHQLSWQEGWRQCRQGRSTHLFPLFDHQFALISCKQILDQYLYTHA